MSVSVLFKIKLLVKALLFINRDKFLFFRFLSIKVLKHKPLKPIIQTEQTPSQIKRGEAESQSERVYFRQRFRDPARRRDQPDSKVQMAGK